MTDVELVRWNVVKFEEALGTRICTALAASGDVSRRCIGLFSS